MQQRVLVILWMVIVYATTSWLALVFPVADPWLGLVRELGLGLGPSSAGGPGGSRGLYRMVTESRSGVDSQLRILVKSGSEDQPCGHRTDRTSFPAFPHFSYTGKRA